VVTVFSRFGVVKIEKHGIQLEKEDDNVGSSSKAGLGNATHGDHPSATAVFPIWLLVYEA
jgi:hypothetical protein